MDIHYLAPLVGTLWGSSIAFGVWDGLARRVTTDESRYDDAEKWVEQAALNAEGMCAAMSPSPELVDLIAFVERARVRLGNNNLEHRKIVEASIRTGQNLCFIVAAVNMVVLACIGLWPHYTLPELWRYHIVIMFAVICLAPIWGTMIRVEDHWRKWEVSYAEIKRGIGKKRSAMGLLPNPISGARGAEPPFNSP